MRKLTGFLVGAFLLASVSASAAALVLGEPHETGRAASAERKNGCSLELSIPSHKLLGQSSREETTFDSPNAGNRWASVANYQWNADVNRVVNQLFLPPDQVQVHVTQTGGDSPGHYESANSPNATFAAFEVVIH